MGKTTTKVGAVVGAVGTAVAVTPLLAQPAHAGGTPIITIGTCDPAKAYTYLEANGGRHLHWMKTGSGAWSSLSYDNPGSPSAVFASLRRSERTGHTIAEADYGDVFRYYEGGCYK